MIGPSPGEHETFSPCFPNMTTTVDTSRAHMLCEVRAKRERALRNARGGGGRDEEYWLRIAGRLTEWIAHLEHRDGEREVLIGVRRNPNAASLGIRVPMLPRGNSVANGARLRAALRRGAQRSLHDDGVNPAASLETHVAQNADRPESTLGVHAD